MIIETKFDVDQVVWFLHSNKAERSRIIAIQVRAADERDIEMDHHNIYHPFRGDTVGIRYYTSNGKYNEENLFESLDALLNDLRIQATTQNEDDSVNNQVCWPEQPQ